MNDTLIKNLKDIIEAYKASVAAKDEHIKLLKNLSKTNIDLLNTAAQFAGLPGIEADIAVQIRFRDVLLKHIASLEQTLMRKQNELD